jgi:excisionase family DNA binding protein
MTTQEVADLFRVSTMSVYRWAKDGTLQAITIGGTVRFRRSDVDALLTSDGAA